MSILRQLTASRRHIPTTPGRLAETIGACISRGFIITFLAVMTIETILLPTADYPPINLKPHDAAIHIEHDGGHLFIKAPTNTRLATADYIAWQIQNHGGSTIGHSPKHWASTFAVTARYLESLRAFENSDQLITINQFRYHSQHAPILLTPADTRVVVHYKIPFWSGNPNTRTVIVYGSAITIGLALILLALAASTWCITRYRHAYHDATQPSCSQS